MSTLKFTTMSNPSQLTNGWVPSSWKVSTVGGVAEAGAASAKGTTASAATSRNRKRPLMPPPLGKRTGSTATAPENAQGAQWLERLDARRLPQGRPTRRYAGPHGGSRAPNRVVWIDGSHREQPGGKEKWSYSGGRLTRPQDCAAPHPPLWRRD